MTASSVNVGELEADESLPPSPRSVGALAGQLGMSYAARNHGYWLAFLLPTIVFATTPIVMWLGRNRYIQTKPSGSVLGKAMRILSVNFKHAGWSPKAWYRAGFWENALPSRIPVAERPSWMVWDDTFVWEVRRGFKACQVFGFFPLYWLTYKCVPLYRPSRPRRPSQVDLPKSTFLD